MALLRFDSSLDPIDAMLSLQNELARFMRNPSFGSGLSGVGAYPPVNIFESDEGAMVIIEAPGLDPSKLNITGQGRTLTIAGERSFSPNGHGRGYHRRELNEGSFSRSIQLPEDYDVNRAEARYEAGMLQIKVPRSEHARPRQIAVQTV
ncbi:MAG TPA: Hsp20/alpha crystallin family protein [Candidatus Binataceae bacterium]|jgi:HSP20 family protein|nr:Hsp20/alpha crystallin family protein [Candidatus Binataceae bacterium]